MGHWGGPVREGSESQQKWHLRASCCVLKVRHKTFFIYKWMYASWASDETLEDQDFFFSAFSYIIRDHATTIITSP